MAAAAVMAMTRSTTMAVRETEASAAAEKLMAMTGNTYRFDTTLVTQVQIFMDSAENLCETECGIYYLAVGEPYRLNSVEPT